MNRYQLKKNFWKPAMAAVALALIGVLTASAGGINSMLMGQLPGFDKVFEKLFHSDVELASLDQLKSIHSKMSEAQIAAIANFYTKEHWEKLTADLPEDKREFLINTYEPLRGKAQPKDLKKHFPEIMSIIINETTPEQITATMENMSYKEMGSLSLFLDNDGLKTLFSSIPTNKDLIILDNTPDWVLLEMGLRFYVKNIKNYECTFLKQERVGGKLQDEETIHLKYREKPKALYMKWLAGPFKGRELLYNETIRADDIRVREAGFLGVIPVWISVDSPLAMRGTNHTVLEVGMKYLLNMIKKDWQKSHTTGDLSRKNYGITKLDGHNVYVMESIQKKNPAQNYYCHRLRHYIDYTRSMEIKAEVYDWDNKLMEKYTYLDIKLNTDLTDKDFDPDNPEYKL